MPDIISWLEDTGFVFTALLLSTTIGAMMTYGGIKLSKPLRKLTIFLLGTLIAGCTIYEILILGSTSAAEALSAEDVITVMGGGTISGLTIALLEELFDFLLNIIQFIFSMLLGLIVAIWLSFVGEIITTPLQEDQLIFYMIGVLIFALLFATAIMKIANSSLAKAMESASAGSIFLLYPLSNIDNMMEKKPLKWPFTVILSFFEDVDITQISPDEIEELQANMNLFFDEYSQVLLFIIVSGVLIQLLLNAAGPMNYQRFDR